MAHNWPIPVAFKFTIPQSRWVVASVRTEERPPNIFDIIGHQRRRSAVAASAAAVAPARQLRVVSPDTFAGLTVRLLPTELPEGSTSQILIGRHSDDARPKSALDPWEARREFLKLDGVAALRDFLNRYGDWQERGEKFHERTDASVVLPWGVWREQKELKEAMAAGPNVWFASLGRPLSSGVGLGSAMYRTMREFPYHYHEDACVWGAIKTATTVDFLRGSKFSLCSRVDCRQPFEARSGKLYCSWYCAHIVSVRKGRKAEQAERKKDRAKRQRKARQSK